MLQVGRGNSKEDKEVGPGTQHYPWKELHSMLEQQKPGYLL